MRSSQRRDSAHATRQNLHPPNPLISLKLVKYACKRIMEINAAIIVQECGFSITRFRV